MTTKQPKRSTRMPQQEEEYLPAPQKQRGGGYQRQSMVETVIKAFIRSIASSIGRILVRTVTKRMR